MNQTSSAWSQHTLLTEGSQYSQRRNRSAARLVLILIAGLALSACGNKGPLKLPEQAAQATVAYR